jgi:hypothetical protein
MLARIILTLVLALAAAPAAADEPYTPPGMTFGPAAPAPATPAAPGAPADPVAATTTASSAYRGGDLGFGLFAGRGLLGFDVEVLADLTRLAVGFRGASRLEDASNGVDVTGIFGLRQEISRTVRLDLLGEAGLALYRVNDHGTTTASGSTAGLPLVGVRAGLTWYRPNRFVRLGAMVRSSPGRTVAYTETECLLFFCSSREKEVRYGGTAVGAYLTFGYTYSASAFR